MKFLNEEIELNFNNLPVTQFDQTHTYNLYQNGHTVFVGTVFKSKNDTSIKVNVTELLQSMHYENDALELPLRAINSSIQNGVVDDIYASIDVSNNTYNSQHESVAFVYKYPHTMNAFEQKQFYPPNYQYVALTNMCQGVNGSDVQSVLLPRIPWTGTNNYGFGTVYQQFNWTAPAITFSGLLVGNIPLNSSANTNIYYNTLHNFQMASDIARQTDMLDPLDPYLVSGQTKLGNAVWYDNRNGEITTASANADFYIGTASSNGYFLQKSENFKLKQDELYELDIIFKGNPYFYSFAIGNLTDKLIIPIVAGHEAMFQDNNIRKFRLKCHLKKSGTSYQMTDLVIEYIYTEDACMNLGINKIANIDILCVEDYYLQWIDRYGSFQSQPFKGTTTFTESIDSLEIQNYIGERRKTYWKTQGKFQVNSGWLSDKVYPIYESIYTSPYLLLYDVKNGKSYNVICMDNSYEEKKFKGKRQIINMQLNLEINKAQSKIY